MYDLPPSDKNRITLINSRLCSYLRIPLEKTINCIPKNWYLKFTNEKDIMPFIKKFGILCFNEYPFNYAASFINVKPIGKKYTDQMYITGNVVPNSSNPTKAIVTLPFSSDIITEAKKIRFFLGENLYIRKYVHKYYLLSKRELQIIAMLSKGLKTSQVAEKLFLSKYTVEQHKKNIKKKTGLSSLAQIIQFAINFKLIKV